MGALIAAASFAEAHDTIIVLTILFVSTATHSVQESGQHHQRVQERDDYDDHNGAECHIP